MKNLLSLNDDERLLAEVRTYQEKLISNTVLHQVLQIAVDDDFIRNNPSDNVLRELKKAHCFQSEKRRALTKPEQELFLNFLKTHPVYEHWYPVFAVMIGTGLRVGEVTGLRWCDIDMESGMIDVNHTLVYYDHRTEGSKSGCYEVAIQSFELCRFHFLCNISVNIQCG